MTYTAAFLPQSILNSFLDPKYILDLLRQYSIMWAW